MKELKVVTFLFMLLVISTQLEAKTKYPGIALPDNISKTTVTYVQRDSALRMDIYQDKNYKGKPQPVVIHLFGGGFMTGSRNNENHSFYIKNLVENGITAVMIDYRLGFNEPSKKKPGDERSKIERILDVLQDVNLVERTFDMPVEDLYSATNYLIDNSNKFNIDTECIIISGSSAGALTVLRAEQKLKNGDVLAKVLPSGFTYKGIISFAGALYSNTGYPTYEKAPAPTLFFHGLDDEMVRYKGIRFMKEGLFTAKMLRKSYRENFYPYVFYSLEGRKHQYVTNEGYAHYFDEILSFIQEYVYGSRKAQKEYTITYIKDDIISSYEEKDDKDSDNNGLSLF